MARKRRTAEAVETAAAEKKPAERYEDSFQKTVGRSIEGAGRKLEGNGRNILYGLGALAVLGIIIWIFYAWNGRSNAAAQAELGKAITTSQAQITDSPPAGSTQKTFKTEKERAQAAIAEFEAVAAKFGGSAGEKAKYFAAVNRMSIDRAAAQVELESLSKTSGEVGTLSKFALANAKASDGQLDQAAALYQELAGMSDPVVSKDTINLELAKLYEKQGKKQEAVDVFFNIVKTASEAKDADGKPIMLSPVAQTAKERLTALDPERAKQIPEPASPGLGGLPFGN